MAIGVGKELRGIKGIAPVEKYEPPSTMHINLKKHKGMSQADIGKTVHFQGHGKVTALHKDEMGHSLQMDIHHISPKGE